MNEGEQMSDDVEYVTWDFGDWPEVAPTEILPGLWMGGLTVDEYVGQPLGESHYSFDNPYDIVVTLFGDAQPAPWGVIELRYGFPDDELEIEWALRCVALSDFAHVNWASGRTVLVRCQQGVNRSGLVMALMLMRAGRSAPDAIELIRTLRGIAVRSGRVPSTRGWRGHVTCAVCQRLPTSVSRSSWLRSPVISQIIAPPRPFALM
jgi:hypothetical protein